MTKVTVFVCTTCKQSVSQEAEPKREPEIRAGQRLLDAIQTSDINEGVEVHGVECLSACDFGCNIAITGPDRWTYVYGKINVDDDVSEIIRGINAYAQSDNGIVPWRERPVIFRKQSIARIPPTSLFTSESTS